MCGPGTFYDPESRGTRSSHLNLTGRWWAELGSFWPLIWSLVESWRYENPWFVELDALTGQTVYLFFYFEVVGLVEFAVERIHSHLNQRLD